MDSLGNYFIYTVVIAAFVIPSKADIDYVGLLRKNKQLSEDGRLDFKGLAAKYGHPAEEHYVITDDGYNLTLFRLPGDKSKPVFLSHGDTVDADSFVVRGNTSLAIVLADKGYDVWVIAYRGTIYSYRHVAFDPYKEPQRYYNFTYYERGIYDAPVAIDYALEQTGQKQLLAIGYSVGTTAIFVLASERPEYNDKIKAFIALAPVAFEKNQQGLSLLGYGIEPVASPLSSVFGVTQYDGRNQSTSYVLQAFCISDLPLTYEICAKALVFSRFGFDEEGFEPEFLKTFYGHFPGGSTKKMYEQYAQVFIRDKFAKYDYGPTKNKQLYNSSEPPEFDLSKATMKMLFLVGKADFLSTELDVERLAGLLPNVVLRKVLPYEKFNHFDFVYGRYMTDNLYPYLLDLVEKYI